MQEIHVADEPSDPELVVRLWDGMVVTADQNSGLRMWELSARSLVTSCSLDGTPTCLAIDEGNADEDLMHLAVGLTNGAFGIYRFDKRERRLQRIYGHVPSSNGALSAIAYSYPYLLTTTASQLLSLYTCAPLPANTEPGTGKDVLTGQDLAQVADAVPAVTEPQKISTPRLLASLKSHTAWPPLSIAIRPSSKRIIASIAYALPTYLNGWSVGLQELHLTPSGEIANSRLASALEQGFQPLLSTSALSPSNSPSSASSFSPQATPPPTGLTPPRRESRPTSLSYTHPYLLASHPDNTLTLYLVTSSATSLSIAPGTKLWGHTSSVSGAQVGGRGKAVSVSTRGNELRVWELEGGVSSAAQRRRLGAGEMSVMVRPENGLTSIGGDRNREGGGTEEDGEGTRSGWVSFDDEVVVVLNESGKGAQDLVVYDFT